MIISQIEIVLKDDENNVIRKENFESIARAERFVHELQCPNCGGFGYTAIPAHQSGGNIVDEERIPCRWSGHAQ